MLAISSASTGNNIYLVRHAIPKLANSSKLKAPTSDNFFDMVTSYSCKQPVYDIAWQGNKLLCGSSSNSVEILQLSDQDDLRSVGHYAHVVQEVYL